MHIAGDRVLLRDEIRESDYEDFFHWRNLDEWNYYDEPDVPFKPTTRDEFEQWRQQARAMTTTSRTWQVDTHQGKHIGWVNYYHLDEQAGSAFVGIALPEPETWGNGFGTEAVRLIVDYLFREMGLQIVRTKTWTGNKRMRRVAEKAGFREKTRSAHRAPFSVRGEPLEFVEYAVSRADWLAGRQDDA